MGRVVKGIIGIGAAVVGVVTGNWLLVAQGAALVGSALIQPGEQAEARERNASSSQIQLGEVPREAVVGRAAVTGSLVDGFNYGGEHGTDWEVLILDLADHRSDALEGFFVNDTYVPFAGDGMVAGYNNQLQVYFRDGQWDQALPAIVTANGPGWTANDRGRGITYVVVAYKADDQEAENPVWTAGRPRFRWVLRGLKCYQARKDASVGGSGAHDWADPATREWTDNPIDCRYNWARGIYLGDRVDDPNALVVGRGLTTVEAPPANVFARANLCDELVDGEKRYRVGGAIRSTERYLDVESDFAAACAGTIVQPEGAVEIDPGAARAPVAHITDADLVDGTKVIFARRLSINDDGWINTVFARFVSPEQGWTGHTAPVRRVLADVVADGGPREAGPTLSFVQWVKQAGRIAEIIRALGRLWGRASITLPPEFCELEEGDWVTWQSDRYAKGATITFQIEAWGSDKAWRHHVKLREIEAGAFGGAVLEDDGAVANQPGPPAAMLPPGIGTWTADAGYLASGDMKLPALVLEGAADDSRAQLVRVEYVQQAAAPDAGTSWTDAGAISPRATKREIPAAPGATYYLGVSYLVDGVPGPRRVLGPVTAGPLRYSDDTLVDAVKPAEPGAQANPADLAELDPTANTKLGGIAAGATVGATWGDNVFGRPAELIDGRVAAGLSQSGDVLRNLPSTIKNLINVDQISDGSTYRRYPLVDKTKLGTIEQFASPSDSFVANPQFENAGEHWSLSGAYYVSTDANVPGKFFLRMTGDPDTTRAFANGASPTKIAGNRAYFSMYVRMGNISDYLLVFARVRDSAGAAFSYPTAVCAQTGTTLWRTSIAGPFQLLTGYIDLPAGAATADFYLQFGPGMASYCDVTNVRATQSELNSTKGAVAGDNLRKSNGTIATDADISVPTLNQDGTMTIVTPSGPINQGAIALDWVPEGVTNKFLLASERSKLGGVEANATVGAPAGTNVGGTEASAVAAGAGRANVGLSATGDVAREVPFAQIPSGARNSELTASITAAGETAQWSQTSGRPTNLSELDSARATKLDGVQAGAQVNPADLAALDATASNKLAGIEANADVTANAQITFTDVTPYTIQADSAGATTTGMPVAKVINVYRGNGQVTSGVSVGAVTTSPSGAITATASQSGGVVTVSLTKADAAGSITIPITVAGITYSKTITVNRTLAAPVSGGGSGSVSFTDQQWENVNSTTAVQVTDAGAIVRSDASGQIEFSASAMYDGSGAATIVAEYRPAAGGAWSTAFSATGSVAVAEDPGPPAVFGEAGFVGGSATKTGLTADADYEVRLTGRRASGSGTLSWASPSFTAKQP